MSKASPFIFISYSRKDSRYVEALSQAFESRGVSVWIDNNIDHGARWQAIIENHLMDCAAFAVVMSSRSRASHWVQCECLYALELKKKVFPLLLDGGKWLTFCDIQHADVTDSALPSEGFFDSVKNHVSSGSRTLSVESVVPPNINWAGDWFVNVGEGVHRTWRDCVKYGFIAAGQGSAYIKGLKKLDVGSTIYAYISGHGYVGVGTVTRKAIAIKDFTVGSGNTPLLEMPLKAERPDENKDDPKLSEWAAGVNWAATVPKEQARRFVGAFANPQVVCKLKHRRTLEFLYEEFKRPEGATNGDDNQEDREPKKLTWIGDWFINVGEGEGQRSWVDCRKYGFISAGGGAKFAAAMQKLEIGSTFFAYVSGKGYVGFGRVIEAAVPIKSFTVGSDNTPLLEMDLEAEGLAQNSNDPELSEWVARVDWLKILPKDQACWATGLFAHVGTLCKLRDEGTLKFLYGEFGIQGNRIID